VWRGRLCKRKKNRKRFGPLAKSGLLFLGSLFSIKCFQSFGEILEDKIFLLELQPRRNGMIISMKKHATREGIDAVTNQVNHFGYKVHSIEGEERVVIA